jgi:serine/threonine protein kinase
MAHGALPDDRGKWNSGQDKTPPPWDYNIVHRDIEPQNYFLSTPSDSIVWPELPITALADFGNAFDAAGPQYTNKPRLARGMGKPLWEAPEQHNDSPDLYTVSSATNVYQIGLSILQMMHLQWPAHETSFSDPRRRPIYPALHRSIHNGLSTWHSRVWQYTQQIGPRLRRSTGAFENWRWVSWNARATDLIGPLGVSGSRKDLLLGDFMLTYLLC